MMEEDCPLCFIPLMQRCKRLVKDKLTVFELRICRGLRR
jgi:hypothetical protein